MKHGSCLVSVVLALSCTGACNRSPSDLREWQPSDHHHQQEPDPAVAADPRAPRVSGSAQPPVPGLEEVTIAAWRRACTSCHGELGRGDGPQGPMVRARDLSDPAWQASVTDEQMSAAIAAGRGLMPPSGLPADTVKNLVKLVRLLNRGNSGPAGQAPQPSASAPTAK